MSAQKHFHLKPRRGGDERGDLFLFEKELQESRWVLDPRGGDNSRLAALEREIEKIEKGVALAKKHEKLMDMVKWLKPQKRGHSNSRKG